MITEKAMNEEEWHKLRSKGVGGSDVAALCGLSKWATALDVYNRKLGITPPTESNEYMYWGNVLENVVAQEYGVRTGTKVIRRNQTIFSAEHPFMLANIDRWVAKERKILECKTADRFAADQWGEAGTDEIPDAYLLQVQHYMTVLGVNKADVAVLIGGNDFRIYNLENNRALAKRIIEIEGDFWNNNIKKQVPPEPQNLQDVQKLYKKDSGLIIDGTEKDYRTAVDLLAVKNQINELANQKDNLEFQLKKTIGENSVLRFSGEEIATWKAPKPSMKFDTNALKETMPNIYKKFVKEQEGSRRFNLKLKGK